MPRLEASAVDFGSEGPFERGAVSGAIRKAGPESSDAMRELARLLWSGPDSPVRLAPSGRLEVRVGGAWESDEETAPRVVGRLLDIIYESGEGKSLIQRESLWITCYEDWLTL